MAIGDEGFPFMKSKEGIVRLGIIILGCPSFVLIAVAGFAGPVTWVMAAYIISWIISLHSYFFIATRVASHMKCGVNVSYDDVDICLSVFSFFNCLIASIVLAIYASGSALWIAADVLGFLVSLLYALELSLLRETPPLNLKYFIGRNGLVKASIFVVGCSTFVLLNAAGYSDPNEACSSTKPGCGAARTFAFAAYIYCWIPSTILLFLRLIKIDSRLGYFELFDMFWAIFSFINYLVASIVLANYLDCTTFATFDCGTRLAAVILGFYVSFLYFIDFVLLKRKFGRVLDKNVFKTKPQTTNRKFPARVVQSHPRK